MSRSKRKTPIFKAILRYGKKFANKRVRRWGNDIGDFCYYKRLYQQYDVIDWIYLGFGVKTYWDGTPMSRNDWERFYLRK